MKKILLLVALLLLVGLYNWLDLGDVLSLEYFSARKAQISAYVEQHFVASALL
ncbi:MAG: hypothetical protein HKO71_08700, partial [Pseudomonadales bacterium]|nr:hypothetical protein [Pseudomonadales bacterium]